MEDLLARARGYLDAMEADHRAALALSQQKAEEAKLIEARQEGFRAAMTIFGGEISVGQTTPDPESAEPKPAADASADTRADRARTLVFGSGNDSASGRQS